MTLIRSSLISTIVVVAIASCLSPYIATDRGHAGGNDPSAVALEVKNASQLPRDGAQASSPLASAAISAVTTPAGSEATDCDHLPQDHQLRTKLNGNRLPLAYDGLQKGLERSLLTEAKVRFLSDGRVLAGLGETLYMFDARRHVQWKYKPSWILWDFAFVESTGLVYGGAGDGIMFILDGSTGNKLYSHFQNGKADHLQVVPFGADMCLITNSLAGYREALDEWAFGRAEMIEPDFITAWRGTEALWSSEFPPDAELVVNGVRIFAVTKTDKGIYVREIIPPQMESR